MVIHDIYQDLKIDKPYGAWRHPHTTWKDAVFTNILVGTIFPVVKAKFHQYHPVEEREKAVACIQEFREGGSKNNTQVVARGIRAWEKQAGCLIGEMDYKVPRPKNLIREWGIADVDPHKYAPKQDITVKLNFPLSILQEGDMPSSNNNNNERLPNRCVPIRFDNIATQLPQDIPLLIWFHGGGMTLGHAQMDIESAVAVAGNKPCVVAFVEYSLAPEVPFPTPIEEALATISHFIELFPNHPSIHLGGISAGGYIGSVCTMEIHRRYPGRLKSSLLAVPCTDPCCDSPSYRANANQFPCFDWIKWCWQSWLELPSLPPKDSSSSQDDEEDQTNRSAWNASPYKGTSLERLINPMVDPPTGLNGLDAPTILVTTNRADMLYSEGITFVDALEKANAKVTHLDHNGSHWFGTFTDRAAHAELMDHWHKMLFL